MGSGGDLDDSYDVALTDERGASHQDRSESLEPTETARPLNDQIDIASMRIFSTADKTLFLRVMGRIGTRCTYAAMAETINDVFREEKWPYAPVISRTELVKKIINKLKTLNKHHTHRDIEKQKYDHDPDWYRQVEERIVQRLKDSSHPVRASGSGSSNVRQSSRRIRYSDAEEKMFRHWMVTLTENAVGHIFHLYEETRKKDMLKHKLREVRKMYSVKEVKMAGSEAKASPKARKANGRSDDPPVDPGVGAASSDDESSRVHDDEKASQLVSYHRLYKVAPGGHFDESAKEKWAPGPIPEADIAAFRRRVYELKRESQPMNTSDFDMLDTSSALVGDDEFDPSNFNLPRGLTSVDDTDRFISEHLRDATADLGPHVDNSGTTATANLIDALKLELESLNELPHNQNTLPFLDGYSSILQSTLKVCREVLVNRQGNPSPFSFKRLLEREQDHQRAALAQVQNYMSSHPASHSPTHPTAAAAAAVAAAVGQDGKVKDSPNKRQKTR